MSGQIIVPGTSNTSNEALSLVGTATYTRFELKDTRNKGDWNSAVVSTACTGLRNNGKMVRNNLAELYY